MTDLNKTGWKLDGKTVTGTYCGTYFEGVVVDSRAMYGTDIQYTVQVEGTVVIHGENRTQVLVTQRDIDEVIEPSPVKELNTMTTFKACSIVEGFADGEYSEEEQLAAWQHLVDTGDVWTLQGSYGRNAAALIEAGYIHDPRVNDSDGREFSNRQALDSYC